MQLMDVVSELLTLSQQGLCFNAVNMCKSRVQDTDITVLSVQEQGQRPPQRSVDMQYVMAACIVPAP